MPPDVRWQRCKLGTETPPSSTAHRYAVRAVEMKKAVIDSDRMVSANSDVVVAINSEGATVID